MKQSRTLYVFACFFITSFYNQRFFDPSNLIALVPNISNAARTRKIRLHGKNVDPPPSAAVCVIAKDDEAYINEWVDYHRALGFSHFFVYDDSEDNLMKQWGQEKGENVTLIHYPAQMKQSIMYNAQADCARRAAFGGRYQWIAFFDIRTFLILKQHSNVRDFLDAHCPTGALRIHRMVFGTAGQRTYRPKPVTKRFLYRQAEPDERVNIIFRTQDLSIDATNQSIHLEVGSRFQDTSGEVNVSSAVSSRKPSDVAVFHYYLRSEKEYFHKMGKPVHFQDSENIPDNVEYNLTNGTVFDDSAWEAVKRLVPKYSMYDLDLAGEAPRYPSQHPSETAVICALLKYEEAYVDEWVDYHHALGFSDFYLYDNSPGFELEQWASEKGDHVTMTHFPQEGGQSNMFTHCLKEHAAKMNHTWVAFLDADEMVILKKHNNIVDLLHEHCESGALSLNWIQFGPGRREVYEPLPYSKRLLYRQQGDVDDWLKTIGRVEDIDLDYDSPHPHRSYLKNGIQHDTNGEEMTSAWNPDGPIDVAFIHHYFSKSYREFIAKRVRGDAYHGNGKLNDTISEAQERRLDWRDPRFSVDGWENTKRFLPKYQLFDHF